MLQNFKKFPETDTTAQKLRNQYGQYIDPTCRIINSYLGDYVDMYAKNMVIESTVEDYTYAAGEVQIIYSHIGKFCSIARSAAINPGNHPQWRVTQHHSTYRRISYDFHSVDDEKFFQWRKDNSVEIGHDVWIGHAAIILPGVKVGTGSIIGSGAVVTKDIPPYSIAVGIPAKVVKKRFDDKTIEKIMRTEWWNWDRAKIEESFNDLLDTNVFLEKYA